MYTVSGGTDRNSALEQYAPLVKRIAHHLMARLPASVEVDDLIQVGMMGLLDAISRYQETQGVQFESYATQRIRGAMLDELRRNDWLPRGVRRDVRRIEDAVSRLQQRLGRPPTEKELAAELKMPLDKYQQLLQEARGYQLLYIDDYSDDSDSGRDNFLDRHCADRRADPFIKVQDQAFRGALIRSIDDLPEREQLLMGLYYEQELNFREIAEILGVTESRVCQLHSQAVARLRVKLKDWVAGAQ